MTTPAEASRTTSALERISLLGGAAYVVLLVIGTIFWAGDQPDTSGDPNKLIKYWGSSSHRGKMHVGWLLATLGVFCFIWFLAALRTRLRDADASGFLARVATIGGTLYATSVVLVFALEDGIKTMSDDTFHHQVYPELIHAADDAGWVMHAGAAVGISALIIAASVAWMRLGAVAKWVSILSIIAGVISLFALIFFPIFVTLLWILIASIGMFVRSGRTVPPPA